MNKFKKLVMLLALSGAGSTAAAVDFPAFDCRPYVGLDAQYRNIQYPRQRGGNLFAKQLPQVNGYVGLQFNECLGAELGYESSFYVHRSPVHTAGDSANGADVLIDSEFARFDTFTQFQGVHGSLVGKYPLFCSDVQLIGTVGLTYLQARLEAKPFDSDLGRIEDPDEFKRSFKQSKLVARLGAGLQYMISDCAGIRGLIIWENTNQFSRIRPKEFFPFNNPTVEQNIFARLRNSYIFSLGIFMNF